MNEESNKFKKFIYTIQPYIPNKKQDTYFKHLAQPH